MHTPTALRDISVLKPTQLSDTWEQHVPITFDRHIAPGYEHDILITSRLLCVSQWLNNWLWWPIKPKFGSTRIWLYATHRDKALAHNNPVLQEIAQAVERVNKLDTDDRLSFVVAIRKSVMSIEFPNEGDMHKSVANAREHTIKALMCELSVIDHFKATLPAAPAAQTTNPDTSRSH